MIPPQAILKADNILMAISKLVTAATEVRGRPVQILRTHDDDDLPDGEGSRKCTHRSPSQLPPAGEDQTPIEATLPVLARRFREVLNPGDRLILGGMERLPVTVQVDTTYRPAYQVRVGTGKMITDEETGEEYEETEVQEVPEINSYTVIAEIKRDGKRYRMKKGYRGNDVTFNQIEED